MEARDGIGRVRLEGRRAVVRDDVNVVDWERAGARVDVVPAFFCPGGLLTCCKGKWASLYVLGAALACTPSVARSLVSRRSSVGRKRQTYFECCSFLPRIGLGLVVETSLRVSG